ncbi:shikimate kinase [Dactylosporangium sp. NPDC049742]|uniref:shikimate kinase n=1 Tax=Dactylosporangium sp. NPDC049742 TaxID=3154737 RepID=UPI003448F08A
MSVVGNSGSGKSTLGKALATRLGVPFVELDAIHHLPGWQPIDVTAFRKQVGELADGDGWVIDGNYSAVRDLVWARADTVIWFDLPRRTVMRQLLWRTLRRGVTRQVLWNGNREHLGNLFRLDPQRSILRWCWTRHHVYRDRYTRAATERRDIVFIRIAAHQDAAHLLA